MPETDPFQNNASREINIENANPVITLGTAARSKDLYERYLVEPVLTEEEIIKKFLGHRSRVAIEVCGHDIFAYV